MKNCSTGSYAAPIPPKPHRRGKIKSLPLSKSTLLQASFTGYTTFHSRRAAPLSEADPLTSQASTDNIAHSRNKRAGALSHRSRLHLWAKNASNFSWRWMLSTLSNQGFSQANCDRPPDADSAPSQNTLCPTSHEAQCTWELSGAAVTRWWDSQDFLEHKQGMINSTVAEISPARHLLRCEHQRGCSWKGPPLPAAPSQQHCCPQETWQK